MYDTLTATDLKQYTYCPRVVYYMRCLPEVRPMTAKMEEGIVAHDEAETRERRRGLGSYGFTTGQRYFDVSIYSANLRLTALIDMIIVGPDGQDIVAPVDYKLSQRTAPHFELQLACYGMMCEEEIGRPAPFGFLYLIPERRAVKVALTRTLRRQVQEAVDMIHEMIEHETMPAPNERIARCVNCEFRRFCNDIL
jgi:CRISPR-associated exonuclease Cas4